MHLQDSHLKFLIFLSKRWGTPHYSGSSQTVNFIAYDNPGPPYTVPAEYE